MCPPIYIINQYFLSVISYNFYKITDSYLTGPKPEGKSLLNTSNGASNIIPYSQTSNTPINEFMQQKHLNFNDWLEELKRKRRKMVGFK